MRITLSQSEVMDAINAYVTTEMKSQINFNDHYIELTAEVIEPVREQKKHKNGKVMKNEYGYAEWEIVRHETKHLNLDENTDFSIYIEPNYGEETS